ncbi:MAG TPA: DUF1206 domain-containing protein, partial [Polyangiales bacterium]|nr:DUF1206 domain-containing protein [Polyangiales bacterium]
YGLVGTLALLTALGLSGGRITDGKGAVRQIGSGPWGEALLYAVGFGLVCYSLWGAVRALLDPEHNGRRGGALLKRCGYAASSISHALLALYAFQLAAHSGGGGGGKSAVIEWLNRGGGSIALGIVGLCVLGYGLVEVYRAIRGRVARELDGSELQHRDRVRQIARVGVASRGTVFTIIGGSFIIAAIESRASEAETFGGALRELASQPFGTLLLGVVAAGLVAYGVYMFFLARYAQVPRAV